MTTYFFSNSRYLLLCCFVLFYSDPMLAQPCVFLSGQIPPFLEKNKEQKAAWPRGIVKIPIVFHVIWGNPEGNIANTQIYAQLDALNRDFQKQNHEIGRLPTVLRERAADMQLVFVLAQDSLGMPAVFRKHTTLLPPIVSTDIHYDSLGGSNAFQPEKCLNIWVCDLGKGILGYTNSLGFGNLNEEGVVINYRNLGSSGTASGQFPYHLGRTLTHEIGHYLGLLHPWGFLSGECTEDDLVADTPPQYEPVYGCPSKWEDVCSDTTNLENFMGLVDDCCMAMFTKGQKSRVYNFINTFRPELLSNTWPTAMPPLAVKTLIFPNPARDAFNIDLVGLSSGTLRIIDINGISRFKSVVSSGIQPFCIAELSKGPYFIEVSNDKGKVVCQQKLVVW